MPQISATRWPSTRKTLPHTTFDLEKGFALARGGAITARIRNIFNDRYRITFLNAQGNHYAAGRTFELGWQFRPRLSS